MIYSAVNHSCRRTVLPELLLLLILNLYNNTRSMTCTKFVKVMDLSSVCTLCI